MLPSRPMKIWLLVAIPALLLSAFPGARCSQLKQRTLTEDVNATQAGNKTNDSGDSLPSTIYPPPTTIRAVVGFTAETGSTGSPFLKVVASPPSIGAMTGSAGTKPMIIVGSIMLIGCVGGGVYLWYLRKAKLDAEHADAGGEDVELVAVQDGELADPEPDDDENEDAVPEP